MGILSKGPYQKVRRRLYDESRIDFEREALDVLRVAYPDLRSVRESGELDRSGLDLYVLGDAGETIEIGVQCKGFERPSFGASQRRQCLESVASLRKSGLRVGRYVLALNRDVRRAEDRARLDEAMATLVRDDVAGEAAWFDPGALVVDVAERVQGEADALIERANRMAQAEHAERLGQAFYRRDVPFRSADDVGRDPGAALARLVRRVRETREAIARREGVPPGSVSQKSVWAFVVGEFGFGKTSLLLGLQDRDVGQAVYLPAARFRRGAFVNEFTLGREIVGVLRERPYDAHDLADVFLLTNLRTTLRSRPDVVVLFDGLDEHPEMYTEGGLGQAFSCFADFGGVCVFSARREFWEDRAGDLDAALGTNPRRRVLLQMEEWTREDVLDFVGRYRARVGDAGDAAVAAFETAVKEGRYEAEYGDIPKRPLFLQMLLDDLSAGEAAARSLAELYERYLVRKFARDREGSATRAVVRRPLAAAFAGDRLSRAGRLLRVLDRVAAEAVVQGFEGVERMAPIIKERSVRQALSAEGVPIDDTVDVLQHTVLVPAGARTLDGLRLQFAHRSFQEFFLARAMLRGLRTADDAAAFGEGVVRFVEELRGLGREWE